MIRISVYVLAIAAIAGFYFASTDPCEARLRVLNESGRTISNLRIATAGGKWQESRDLAFPASQVVTFSDFEPGSYAVHIAFEDGEIISDTLGHLDPRAAFRDTLAIRTGLGAGRFDLKQNVLPCREGFHLRSFLRRALRHFL